MVEQLRLAIAWLETHGVGYGPGLWEVRVDDKGISIGMDYPLAEKISIGLTPTGKKITEGGRHEIMEWNIDGVRVYTCRPVR